VMPAFRSFEMVTFGYTWIALFYACFLLAVVVAKNKLMAGLMRAPLLRHFGSIAYVMYLIHMPIISLMHGLILGTGSIAIANVSGFAATILAFAATWFLAALSWKFLEKPILRWGHSFTYASRGTVKSEPAASNPAVSS
jgi:peptidoglycan/LPS O-acetylase OafA/YrhL